MGFIVSALGGIFATLSGLIINVLVTLSNFALRVAVNIFDYFSSKDFIALSYTSLDGNPFLAAGWTLTRDLTNIVFIVILIAIGLGTALKFGDFDARKTLPKLIMIALLINFTPVILGIIVDSANIIMNFFIQDGFASGNYFANASSEVWNNFSDLAGGLKFWDPIATGKSMAAALAGGALLVFNVVAIFYFIIFSILFIVRYVAIWMLVIVSPFAFAAFILPATKKYWNDWWDNFIKWSFIGVIAAFFLYLTDHLMFAMKDIQIPIDEIAGAPGLAIIMSKLLPYVFVLIFMTIGIGATMSFSPQAAQGIIKGSQDASKKIRGWADRTARSTAAGIRATTPIRRGEEWTRRKMEAVPGLNRVAGFKPGTVEMSRVGQISAASETLKKIPDTPQGNKDIFKRISQIGVDARTRAAGLQILAERKDLPDAATKFFPEAQKAGLNISAIYKARPDLATNLKVFDKSIGKERAMTIEEATKKIEPGDVKLLQKEALKNSEVAKDILLDERKFINASRNMKRENKEILRDEGLRALFTTGLYATLDPAHKNIIDERLKVMSKDKAWVW